MRRLETDADSMHALLVRFAAGLATPSPSYMSALGAALPPLLSTPCLSDAQRQEFVARMVERVRWRARGMRRSGLSVKLRTRVVLCKPRQQIFDFRFGCRSER